MLGQHQKSLKNFFVLACTLFLASCTSLEVDHSQSLRVSDSQRIVVLPFNNLTETPQADERAAAITANILRTKGMTNIYSYPYKSMRPSLIPGVKQPVPRSALLAFAKSKHTRIAMVGSVTEWNYKVGLDGEPAIGLNLQLIDIETGHVIWSSVGSKSGGSRTALSSVAQVLIDDMLNGLHIIGTSNES